VAELVDALASGASGH